MLQSLSIKNYALLADVEIKFGAGLNMLTGETGAGKSILIGALGSLLGDRVDGSILRDGESKAVIEGQFEINGTESLNRMLSENNLLSDDHLLILRREIFANTRSRAFVNDSPVTLSLLQKVGEALVDLHGQHDHQSLLKVASHLSFLDDFGDLKQEKESVAEAYDELQELLEKREALNAKKRSLEERKEFFTFQVSEINKVSPSEDEETELSKEEKIIQHSEKLFKLTSELYQVLYDQDNAVFDQMNHVGQGLDELGLIDETFATYKSDFESARLIIEELARAFQTYGAKLEFDSDRLEKIQSRLSELAGLKKRLGRTIPEILKFRDEMEAQIRSADNLESEIEAMCKKIESGQQRFSRLCIELSRKRKRIAEELELMIPEVLLCLGMSEARFKVVLKYQDDPQGLVAWRGENYLATRAGMDFAEFLVSLNKGEDLRSLVKVASGGEISRIMLAIKSIAAKQGRIPVLVFDEIDSGVSGRIAQAVGRKLRELSQNHQVICITHLPQIASMAEQHYLVEKVEHSGRTETIIRELDRSQRTEAIAQLLAGEKLSSAHLNSAKELMRDATFG